MLNTSIVTTYVYVHTHLSLFPLLFFGMREGGCGLFAPPTSCLSLFEVLPVCFDLGPPLRQLPVGVLLVVQVVLGRLPDTTDVLHLVVKSHIPTCFHGYELISRVLPSVGKRTNYLTSGILHVHDYIDQQGFTTRENRDIIYNTLITKAAKPV